MTDRRDPHDPTHPDAADDQSPSPAMTTDIDPGFAALAAELAHQIHAEAGRVSPRRPPFDQLLVTRRPHATNGAGRFRLVLAAAAVLLVLLGALALRPRTEGSNVKVGENPVPVVPWRVGLDPSSPYLLTDAYDTTAILRARASAGTGVAESEVATAPTVVSIAYGPEGDAVLAPPWMEVTMLTYAEGHTGNGSTGGGTPISVASYPGWRFAAGTATGHFGFTLDSRHEIDVKRWGVTEADAIAAAASIRVVDGPSGFELTAPPTGLHSRPEAQSSILDIQSASYATRDSAAGPSSHLELEVRHVPADGVDLAMTVLLGQSSSTPLDQAEIQQVPFRGGTALVRAAGGDHGETVLVVWADRTHEQVGLLRLSGPLADGATTEVTRVLAGLHEIDDAAWQDLVRRCPGIRTGTVPSTAIGSC